MVGVAPDMLVVCGQALHRDAKKISAPEGLSSHFPLLMT